nr:immunoglobulin light chain junction region [Macaca mulatta]MPO06533.1 immunoglobulin light chain junction region [Macaca mulatta]MPO07692.1 immunoglobulin light chain junction region [Macaca mulatta]
CMSWHNNAYIF